MLTQKRLKEVLRYDPCSGKFYWRPPARARIPVGQNMQRYQDCRKRPERQLEIIISGHRESFR